MRTNLRVPFAEKDEAKRLGARWDAARKVWYIENVTDTAPFSRWIPTEGMDSLPETMSKAKVVSNKQPQSAGNTITGSNYAPQPRVCDCLPWDVCDKCRATALSY